MQRGWPNAISSKYSAGVRTAGQGSFTVSHRLEGRALIAALLMGLGAAVIFPATLSLIANVFTKRAEHALAIGLWEQPRAWALRSGPSPECGWNVFWSGDQ